MGQKKADSVKEHKLYESIYTKSKARSNEPRSWDGSYFGEEGRAVTGEEERRQLWVPEAEGHVVGKGEDFTEEMPNQAEDKSKLLRTWWSS